MQYPEDFDRIVIAGRSDFLKHPALIRIALCMHRLEALVNNGGFYEFLSSSAGELVPETLDALTKIEAPQTKRLLEKAIAIAFPGGYPSRPEEAAGALADYEVVADALHALDSSFCAYPEPLSDLVNECLARGA